MKTMKRIYQKDDKVKRNQFKRSKKVEKDNHQIYELTKNSIEDDQHERNKEYFDITIILPSAILSKILFDGFLDTFTVLNVLSSRLCHFITNLSTYSVFSLDLRRCLKMRPIDIRNITYRFPKLQTLDFSYCHQFSNEHLIRLLPLKSTLRRLYLRGCNVTDGGICRFLQTNIKKNEKDDYQLLNISRNVLEEIDCGAVSGNGSRNISDTAVETIMKTCPQISKMLLGYCVKVTDLSIRIIHQQKFQNIKELDLSLTLITDQSSLLLSDLILHGNLRKLDISGTEISNEGIQIIASTGSMNPSMLFLSSNMSTIPNQFHNMSLVKANDKSYSKNSNSYQSNIDASNTNSNNIITNEKKLLSPFQLKTNGNNIKFQNLSENDKYEYKCCLDEFRIRHMKNLSIRSLEILSINARGLKILDISHSREYVNQTDEYEYVDNLSQTIVSSSFWDRVMLEFRRNGTLVVNET